MSKKSLIIVLVCNFIVTFAASYLATSIVNERNLAEQNVVLPPLPQDMQTVPAQTPQTPSAHK